MSPLSCIQNILFFQCLLQTDLKRRRKAKRVCSLWANKTLKSVKDDRVLREERWPLFFSGYSYYTNIALMFHMNRSQSMGVLTSLSESKQERGK